MGSIARSNSQRAEDIGQSIIAAANAVMKDSEEIWTKYKGPITKLGQEVAMGYLSNSPKKRKVAKFIADRLETTIENISLTVFIGATAEIRRQRKYIFKAAVNAILSLVTKLG